MELLLDIFLERRKVYIEWKQFACAVLLALLAAGLYNYIAALPDPTKEYMKERTVAAEDSAVVEPLVDMPFLLKEDSGNNTNARDEKIYPEALAGEENRAVSCGGSAETEDRDRAESVRPAKKRTKEAEKISSIAAEKADEDMKRATEKAPDIPIPDVIAGSPDIPAEKEEDSGLIEKEENGGLIEKEENGGSIVEEEDKKVTDGENTKPVLVWERFPGFLADEKGHITGYTDASKFLKDHLAVFPTHRTCIGIERDALKGLEMDIYEIYIPANITYIADGAFDYLPNLVYIEAAAGNSEFYSENGILYYRNGKVAVCPCRLK